MTNRIIYMGTPQFACPALELLAGDDRVEVSLVVTQPDRPVGRGRKLQAPPVKVVAERLGLPVYQTPSLRSVEQRRPIVELEPDLIVVAAFGLILGKSILDLPRVGCVNLHASLLPLYRGASPISASILNGDEQTGVTLMQMERGLDTGPMLAQMALNIEPEDTTESLTGKLSTVAGDLLVAELGRILDGSLKPEPQPAGASLTRPLVKADGWIDWTQTAEAIERHVRAMWPWPRGWTTLPDGSQFQIHGSALGAVGEPAAPGEVTADRHGLRVCTGSGWIRIVTGQLAGGKPLNGAQLAAHREFRDRMVVGGLTGPEIPGPMVWRDTGLNETST
jgi:methionyl-tRNA formyltransferase